MTLHPLAGLAVALVVAWASILLAIHLPIDRFVDARHLRIGGALALAILALRLLGTPIPAMLPLAPILLGAASGTWARRAANQRGTPAPYTSSPSHTANQALPSQRLSRPPAGHPAVAAPTALPVIQGGLLDTEETAPLTPELLTKLDRLEAAIRARRGVLVAYSGGVDSTLIAAAAVRAVGPYQDEPGQGALAVLADSTTLARRELTLARAVADQIQIPLREVQYSELANPAWAANDGERCYHCKHDLATELLKLAPEHGYTPHQIAFGTTTTDLGDHRPGLRAIGDAAAWQPLVEADLSKAEVRALAKHLGLPVWDKPATPCLASRVQYGEAITAATLERVERAEEALRNLGFRVLRVRHHDRLARIEVPVLDLEKVLAAREKIVQAMKDAGYTYVTLDLVGHRSGAMNEALGA